MITKAQDEILADLMKKAICVASHEKRRSYLQIGFKSAIKCKYDGWALLFKGFLFLLDEEYAKINDDLWEEIENKLKQPSSKDIYSAYFSLRKLLFAHKYRKAAMSLLNQAQNLFADRAKLKKDALETAKNSMELYKVFCDTHDVDLTIKTVAEYYIGCLVLFLKDSDFGDKNSEDSNPISKRTRVWTNAEKHFLKSVELSNTGNLNYAPPLNRLAIIEIWRTDLEAYKKMQIGEPERLVHIREAIKYAQKAIDCSAEIVDGIKRETFAPPLIHKGRALFWEAILNKEKVPYEEIAELLRKAVKCSPYDYPVRWDIESFSKEIKKNHLSKRNKDFYYQTRLSIPTSATEIKLKQYFEYKDPHTSAPTQNEFTVLRRWSSYSPILTTEEHNTVGGGYFLKWGDFRIAIDPGLGYIQNMDSFGYSPNLLDAVIMTHQHVDHNADFEPLLSLFKMYSKTYYNKNKSKKNISILFNESGKTRWDSMLLTIPKLEEKGILMDVGKQIVLAKNLIEIIPTPLIGHPDAVDEAYNNGKGRESSGRGVIFNLLGDKSDPIQLGITSDSGYFSEKGEVLSDYFQDCDIVVLHISTVADLGQKIDPSDFVAIPKTMHKIAFPGRFYKKHLGFWGTTYFILDLITRDNRSDRLILLSEFGEEMLFSRPNILEEIKEIVSSIGPLGRKQANNIFIADIGTRIMLDSKTLLCQCGINMCQEPAVNTFEASRSKSDRTVVDRKWNDMEIIHLCEHHSAYGVNDRQSLLQLIGDYHFIKKI